MLSAAGLGVRGPNRDGDRTLGRRLGMRSVVVSPFCHWRLCVAATGGKETHQGSSNLPHANIYITRSPASLAQGGGWLCWGGVGVGFGGMRPSRSLILRDGPTGLSRSSRVCGVWAFFVAYLRASPVGTIRTVPRGRWQLSPVPGCTPGAHWTLDRSVLPLCSRTEHLYV